MPRLPRFNPIGIPQHVIQRGNNRQVCFNSDEDRAAYANWLFKYATEYEVHIHAWVFMTNHVHLLVTPWQDGGISRMMQSLGRYYVRYYNKTWARRSEQFKDEIECNLQRRIRPGKPGRKPSE